MIEPTNEELVERVEFLSSQLTYEPTPEEMQQASDLLLFLHGRLKAAEEELARQIELRIEDEPSAVRREAARAEAAEAQNAALRQQLLQAEDELGSVAYHRDELLAGFQEIWELPDPPRAGWPLLLTRPKEIARVALSTPEEEP